MSRPSPRFLSQLAHDLRSPLNVIGSTLTELSEESGLPTADRAQVVVLSQRAINRLIALSDRLALASRLDLPAALPLTLEPIDLLTAVRTTLAEFVASQLRQRIEVVTQLQDKPAMVMADRKLLNTLMLELLTNANRYARKKFTVIVATTGPNVTLTIEDDGEGVQEDERSLLFEPFAERRSRTGLGMGLWMARQLAALHQGTLTLEHLSPGTRQSLTLPGVA